MAVTITKLKTDDNSVSIDFTIDKKNDFIIIQEIFRSIISSNFSRESLFGLEFEGIKLTEVPVFDYTLNDASNLSYDLTNSEYSFSSKITKVK